jgi:putative tryptophan/tyrosine transport system substrate-binding protein
MNAPQFAATEAAARAVGVKVEILEVRLPDDLQGAMEKARAQHVEAGILLSSPLVFTHSKLIGDLALAKRLPLISLFGEFPKSGGLLAYGPNLTDMFRRCGGYVGRVLHGTKPGELPIQRPERFDLVINLRSAKAIGLDISAHLQQLADEVIE